MADCQVTCIVKPNRESRHEHITHIGGGTGVNRWKLKREDAIRGIEQDIDTFYVVDPFSKRKAYVAVVYPTLGHPYLRTHADGTWNNNLLELDQCPL